MSAEGGIRPDRHARRIGSAGFLVVAVAVMVGAGIGGAMLLEGDGRSTAVDQAVGFSVSPADLTVTSGQTVTVEIRARSGGEPVNAVQADLLYSSLLLDYSGTVIDDAWDIVGPISGESGQLRVPIASSAVRSGDFPVARASFTAKTAGHVTIGIADSSAIVSATTNRDLLAPPPAPPSPTVPAETQTVPSVDKAPAMPGTGRKIALSVTRLPTSLTSASRHGVPVRVSANRTSTVTVRLIVPPKTARTVLRVSTSKPVVIGSARTSVTRGKAKLMRVKLTPKWRTRVAKLRRSITIQVRTSVVAPNAEGTTILRTLTLRRP